MTNQEKINILNLEVARPLNLDISDLATVVSIESNFNEKAVNKYTGASGIIQFMPTTAQELGYNISQVRAMTFNEQAKLAKKYLEKKNARGLRGVDLYLSVFYPVSVGKENFVYPNSVYSVNSGLDYDKNGKLTYSDIKRFFESKKAQTVKDYDLSGATSFFSLKKWMYFIFPISFILISLITYNYSKK